MTATSEGPSAAVDGDTMPAPGIRPLITASEMFPELERLCLGAREELCLSFRVFDARTRLRSDEAKALELESWADLLTHVAERGVKLRMLLADFDPIFTGDLHRSAWASARIFGRRLPEDAELLCAMHECRSAPVWKWLFWPQIRRRLQEMRKLPDEKMTPFQHQALRGKWDLRPVTLHQKLAVADGERAIIGGLDVDERRWDDPDHEQEQAQTWHDISLLVEGPVCGSIRSHFAECWDRALADDATRFTADATPVPNAPPLPPLKRPVPENALPRVIRTISCRPSGRFRLGADPMLREHEEAHIDAFSRARKSIYIETQFFRHKPLAHALAEAAYREPELELILLLPTEPERLIFDGHDGFDTRHAQALQLRCLDIIRKAFGNRMAVVAPVQPRPARPSDNMPVKGAGIVYVHSKVTLVDDHTAIVGSANLNGRSMKWDTEASLLFHSAKDIEALRERLAGIWLREQADLGCHRKAATWTEAARRNAARKPEEREGFMMPWPERRNRRFARFIPILPPEMF